MSFGFRRGSVGRNRAWSLHPKGSIEWVDRPTFCDMGNCPELASWRIGAGKPTLEFCTKHTLRVMRDRRLWRG